MSQDEFTRLFNYIEKRFDGIDKQLEKKADRQQAETIMSGIDAYAKEAETFMQEMVALSHKVDRLERWINEIAAKTDVKLSY
jgi:polyhydroxyalkanoate synthesis regulator phasin